jgi:hypothetical protein
MRLMVPAFAFNINLAEIANDFVILDMRMKPEEIAATLKTLAAGGPF